MALRVILDVTTRGLDDAQINAGRAPELITLGVKTGMNKWYRERFLRRILEIIEKGGPRGRIPANVGKYRTWKINRYGISHPLGILSGRMYFGVIATQPKIRETRGKEVRFSVDYRHPYYIAYVHDGTSRHVRRPFVEVAKDMELPSLAQLLNKMFDDLDFTRPYPELVSSVIATRL